jgi:hypothetical protein
MNQRMAGSTPLDLAQANQIAALEVAIAVLEFPQRRVWRAGVEDVAHCT